MSAVSKIRPFPQIDIEQLMPGHVTIPVKTREVQPAAKRSIVFDPFRHLIRAFVPLVMALISIVVAAIVITAVGIAAIVVGMIVGWWAMLSALLIVGCGLGRIQEQQTTGQD